MTRRHEQLAHRRKLSEIRNIMNSMKTLAILQTHKLQRFIQTQSTMTATIENMAADFIHFNPRVLPEREPASRIVLLIGSQRGFCGGFNEQLVKQYRQFLSETTDVNIEHGDSTLIALGKKLHPLMDDFSQQIVYLDGADVAEEIANVVDSLAQILSAHQPPAALYAVHHNNHHNEYKVERLLPPFTQLQGERKYYASPPLLNLSAEDFFLELTEHYLYNALHRILYLSLMVENQQRIQHLENASRHLDEKTAELQLKINALRQEEIIEEIEVILLNASSR